MRVHLVWVAVLVGMVIHGGAVLADPSSIQLSSGQPADIALVSRNAERLTVRIDVPELQWGKTAAGGAEWDVVAVQDCGRTGVVGQPQLPVLTRLVAVGSTEGLDARVRAVEVETMGGINLLPAQPPIYRGDFAPPAFAMDEETYSYDQWLPASPTAVEAPVIVHGRRYIPVLYFPVQYNPARGELRVYRQAELEIRGGLENRQNALSRRLPASPALTPIMQDLAWTFNRDDGTDNWDAQDGALLAIVHDEFLPALQPYLEWKWLKGLPVEVVLTGELTGGGTDAEALKTFLYQRYHDAAQIPLDYVLLVGDVEHIATLYGIGACAADSKYATLDGDDYFPDVIVARFPAKNVEQLARTVAKVVAYEQTPNQVELDWYAMGLTTSGSDSQDDQNAAFVRDVLLEDGGFSRVDYLTTNNGHNSSTNISAALNAGRSWMTYFGHGSSASWSSPWPPFTNQDVLALENTGRLPVITSIACDNAHFDQEAECFAELWLEAGAATGAAGIFAASRNTPFGQTDQLGRGVAVGHFRRGYLTFGTAAYFGKMYMYHFYPLTGPWNQTEEVFQHYLIFGDPELNIWSDTPAPLDVQHPTTLTAGSKESFIISVTVNGAPVAGALAHLWLADGWSLSGRTNGQGRLTLADLPDLQPGTLHLFITGRNGLPYQSTIIVEEPATDDDDVTPPADDDDAFADDDVSSDDDVADDDDTSPNGDDDPAADDDDDDSASGGCGS